MGMVDPTTIHNHFFGLPINPGAPSTIPSHHSPCRSAMQARPHAQFLGSASIQLCGTPISHPNPNCNSATSSMQPATSCRHSAPCNPHTTVDSHNIRAIPLSLPYSPPSRYLLHTHSQTHSQSTYHAPQGTHPLSNTLTEIPSALQIPKGAKLST